LQPVDCLGKLSKPPGSSPGGCGRTNQQKGTDMKTPTHELTLAARRICRKAADAFSHCPVEVVDGSDEAPKLVGRTYYWTTPSGKTIVKYPAAYGYRTLYHRSTVRVVVGAGWVAANCGEAK
jgi:hypothetical protein